MNNIKKKKKKPKPNWLYGILIVGLFYYIMHKKIELQF